MGSWSGENDGWHFDFWVFWIDLIIFGFDDFFWVWENRRFWFVFGFDDHFLSLSLSLSQFNISGFFVFVSRENLWVWRLRFALLEIGLIVGFIGFLGLAVLLEIRVWFFVGDWFCKRSRFESCSCNYNVTHLGLKHFAGDLFFFAFLCGFASSFTKKMKEKKKEILDILIF